ncbi:nose resistant to fluoxetine protein 6-like isoform X1 [Branchiostoma lanceolatum]|uniref:nose resistant to fluoxetine protein 6-like isoform X1 n=2 Tax=Branchiostoma lanceolatum TaxID=7740 RepID=UPI003454F35E
MFPVRGAIFALLFVLGEALSDDVWSQQPNFAGALRLLDETRRFEPQKTAEAQRLWQEAAWKEAIAAYNSAKTSEDTAVPSYNVSAACRNATFRYEEDLIRNGKMYALQMFDAAGKLPSGVMEGNFAWWGLYSQCANVTAKGFGENIPFDAKYWTATIGPVFSPQLYLRVGVCVPDICSRDDVIEWLDGSILMRMLLREGITVVDAKSLQVWNSLPGTTLAAICIVSIIVALMAAGTLYDIFKPNTTSPPIWKVHQPISSEYANEAVNETTPLINDVSATRQAEKVIVSSPQERPVCKLLLAFSVRTNTRKLLSTRESPDSLGCLHGIRFLSMTWVILGHTFAFIIGYLDNPLYGLNIIKRFSFEPILNGFLSVDSFFFLSGVLMAYLMLLQLDKFRREGRRFPYWLLYFHRYWRLTPVYAFVMMLYMWVYPYITTGPATTTQPDPGCINNWWYNFLYINNFLDMVKGTECMAWTWYLANDMQFFIISVPIIWLTFKYFLVGMITQSVLLLASFGTTIGLAIHYNLQPAMSSVGQNPDAGNLYYQKPYCRIGPYLVGTLLGYLLYKTRGRFRMHKALALLGWLAATGIGMGVVYGLYDHLTEGVVLSRPVAVMYLTVHRTAWGVALAWVVFACVNGYGGIINTILSWKAWIPLSRLTYCAYLVHPIVIFIAYLDQRETPLHYSDIELMYYFVGHVVFSYAVAYVVSMMAEAPMRQLEKLVLKQEN